MRHVEIDVPHLAVAAPDDEHFLRCLHEKHHRRSDAAEDVPFRHAARITTLARHERHFAGADFVVVALHLRAHPGLKNGIGQIGDTIGRMGGGEIVIGLAASVFLQKLRIVGGEAGVRDIRHVLDLHDRAGAAFGRQKIVAVRAIGIPGGVIVRREIGNCGYCFLGRQQKQQRNRYCAQSTNRGHAAPALDGAKLAFNYNQTEKRKTWVTALSRRVFAVCFAQAVVDMGRGDRGMSGRDRDLMQFIHHIARCVYSADCCTLMLVRDDAAFCVNPSSELP